MSAKRLWQNGSAFAYSLKNGSSPWTVRTVFSPIGGSSFPVHFKMPESTSGLLVYASPQWSGCM